MYAAGMVQHSFHQRTYISSIPDSKWSPQFVPLIEIVNINVAELRARALLCVLYELT